MNTSAPHTESSSRFLTLPNVLSLTRVLLVVPFVLVMLSSIPNARLWACVIVALGALTDKLDGVFARKYNEITEWGRILDPVADKIGIAAFALVLLWLNEIPLWFVIALLARDVLIFSGGLLIRFRTGVVLASNQAGKWAVNVVAATLLLALAGAPPILVTIGIWASVLVLLVSLGSYVVRFMHVMKGQT